MNTPALAHRVILLLLLATFVVQMALSALPLSVLLLTGQILSLLIPLLLFLRRTGGRYRERLALRPAAPRDFLMGLLAVLVLQPFLMLVATVTERLSGNPMDGLIEKLLQEPYWISAVGLALLPALIEELVFRGYLLDSCRRLPLWEAALLNGLVFGLFHMNLYQFSYALILGIVFAIVTRRSGSVLPAMGMHLVNNLISVGLLYGSETAWYGRLDALLQAATTPGPSLFLGIGAALLSAAAGYGVLDRGFRKAPWEAGSELFRPDWAFLTLLAAFCMLAVPWG